MGYTAERTPINEKYVTLKKIDSWIRKNKKVEDIFLIWNQGRTGACRKGVNKYGVRYNSCDYVIKALAILNR